MAELPLAPFERILRDRGAKRIRKEATTEFRNVVEEFAEVVADTSIALSVHAKRKTVVKADVQLAVK